ncbi:MAG: MBOAT family protein [Clostridia bacterium]|nr:MBOAT family protein [Clostridia bacterium]
MTFLLFFLPLTFLVHAILPKRARTGWLLCQSLVFYAVGELRFLPLLILTALWHYAAARLLTRFRRYRKPILALAVIGSLAVLVYYKYAAFFLPLVGISFTAPALPVGISFYTFQAISYTVDVYREDIRATRSPTVFLAYLTLFPQLVAGPIVRYSEVESALRERKLTWSGLSDGAFRFSIGLFKKLVFADTLASFVLLYSQGAPTVLLAWLTAFAYMLEIYFDFSGYSDMAVGLGKLLGFDFPENFNYPYAAKSVTEFWRRWHITLSSFFKSYVYIPLGGSRCGRWRRCLNLLTVWLLTGLWHGASFTFVAWGLFYAILLILEKTFGSIKGRFWGHAYLILVTAVGFVFFEASSLSAAFGKLSVMLGIGASLSDARTLTACLDCLPFLSVSALCSTPILRAAAKRLFDGRGKAFVKAVLTPACLLIAFCFLVGASSHPFLYFRF